MHKRWLLVLLQTVVTVGLLAFFFHDPEFRHKAFDALRHAQPWWLVAGVVVAGVENFLGALRWRIFLKMLGMDVPFFLHDEALDKPFLAESKAAGLLALKGHRALGGMRASIYNAMPIEGVRTLVDYMRDFEKKHG